MQNFKEVYTKHTREFLSAYAQAFELDFNELVNENISAESLYHMKIDLLIHDLLLRSKV